MIFPKQCSGGLYKQQFFTDDVLITALLHVDKFLVFTTSNIEKKSMKWTWRKELIVPLRLCHEVPLCTFKNMSWDNMIFFIATAWQLCSVEVTVYRIVRGKEIKLILWFSLILKCVYQYIVVIIYQCVLLFINCKSVWAHIYIPIHKQQCVMNFNNLLYGNQQWYN